MLETNSYSHRHISIVQLSVASQITIGFGQRLLLSLFITVFSMFVHVAKHALWQFVHRLPVPRR